MDNYLANKIIDNLNNKGIKVGAFGAPAKGNTLLNFYASSGDFITSLVGDAQTPSPWAQTYFDANPEILKEATEISSFFPCRSTVFNQFY